MMTIPFFLCHFNVVIAYTGTYNIFVCLFQQRCNIQFKNKFMVKYWFQQNLLQYKKLTLLKYIRNFRRIHNHQQCIIKLTTFIYIGGKIIQTQAWTIPYHYTRFTDISFKLTLFFWMKIELYIQKNCSCMY